MLLSGVEDVNRGKLLKYIYPGDHYSLVSTYGLNTENLIP
jgi:hypothetical protein